MTGIRPLAAFSDNWIDGDIRGLQDLAGTLYRYAPRVRDLARHLSAVARDLTGPGGWRGQSADAFAASWAGQAKAAGALEEFAAAVASAVNDLAVELSRIQSSLETQAREVSEHGVRIGRDGAVTGFDGLRGLEYAGFYQQTREHAMDEATAARQAATRKLYGLIDDVMNANPHPNATDDVNMSGSLADLVAMPAAIRRGIKENLRKLEGESLSLAAEASAYEDAGLPLPKALADKKADNAAELRKLQEKLSRMGKTANLTSEKLDTRYGDLRDRLQKRAGDGRHVPGNTPENLRAAAENEPNVVEKAVKYAEDMPVVDAVATVIGTAAGTYEDVKHGKPLGSALMHEAISNTLGTVVGNAAGAEVGARLGAEGGPEGLAAGVVAGDLAQNLAAEKWPEDCHDHGVPRGLLDGAEHSVDQTVDDGRELAIGIGHKAEHYWDEFPG